MKILITGGTGFIGTNIAIEATKRGHKVICFDNLQRNGTENNIPVIEKAGATLFRGDVRNEQDFVRFRVEHGKFDGIIHLAANPGIPWSIAYPKYDFEVNALGTINALEVARLYNCPFIFASTNKVYPDIINEIPLLEMKSRYEWKDIRAIGEYYPIDASSKYHHSPYGASKLAGDQYVQEYHHMYGLPTVVNRMSCIYGYYQNGVADQGWIDHFVRQAFTDKPTLDIYGDGKQVRDMLFGTDVARLYIDELEQIDKVNGEVFNVGGGPTNTISLIESIKYIESISGTKFTLIPHDWRPADQKIYISDITKVTSMLNWKPEITPKEGISLMYKKYNEQ